MITRPMKINRQKLLEELLNDKVEKITARLFRWRGLYYEVLPYSLTLKRHNWSGFVRLGDGFMMREASVDIIKKYYSKTIK